MSNENDGAPAGERPRVREDVQLARDAMKMMQPINEQISGWQASVVRLVSVGERLKLHGQHSAEHAAEAETLDAAVRAERQRFTAELALLPAELRAHGRVTDTLKSLDRLGSAVARAVELFRQ